MQSVPNHVAYLRCGVRHAFPFLSQCYCGLPIQIRHILPKSWLVEYRKKEVRYRVIASNYVSSLKVNRQVNDYYRKFAKEEQPNQPRWGLSSISNGLVFPYVERPFYIRVWGTLP